MPHSAADLLWERKRRIYKGKADDIDSMVNGFQAWCSDHVRIRTNEGPIPFVLRDEQLEAARSYIENPRTLVLKARQIGFTTVTMQFVLWRALFWPNFVTIVLSKTEKDAVSALGKAIDAYNWLPTHIRARLPQRLNAAKGEMEFDNGSRIHSWSSGNDPARGQTANLMILDEWAFLEDPEQAWAAVEPVTDTKGGRLVALSTANGWGNLFHQHWVQATKGDSEWNPIFFPFSAVPDRDGDWYERKSKDTPAWQMAQEYPRNPEEAFLKSGRPVFDVDALGKLDTPEPIAVGELVGPNHQQRTMMDDPYGPLKVWQTPRKGRKYVIGGDVAQGLEHGDYSAAHVLDIVSGDVVAVWHGHIDPDLFGVEMYALGWRYNQALVGIEANNHGLVPLKTLQRMTYPNIYLRRRYGSRGEHVSDELGWHTNQATKPLMIDELAMAVREGSLHINDDSTRLEMMTYQRDEKGKMDGTPYDDRVISLAIANQMRKHAHQFDATIQKQVPMFSAEWFERKVEAAERARTVSDRIPLGTHNVRPRRQRR